MQQADWGQGKVAMIAMIYYMLQCTPFFVVAWGLGKFNILLRKNLTMTTRTAELQRRSVFDFVSPAVVILTALCYPVLLVVIFYVSQDPFPDFNPIATIVGITGVYLICILTTVVMLNRKKSNPLLSHAEHRLEIGAITKITVYSLLAAMIFIFASLMLAQFELKTFSPAFSSIFYTFCSWLYIYAMNTNIDQSGNVQYKPDSIAT